MTEILAILKIAEDAYAIAKNLADAAKAKGDPTTQDVLDQMARAKAAQDQFHALLTAP